MKNLWNLRNEKPKAKSSKLTFPIIRYPVKKKEYKYYEADLSRHLESCYSL